MSKKAVIYWSGTGNTEAMANAVLEGINSKGENAEIFNVSEISASKASEYDSLALGCPAMGSEVLEETEFEPFFTSLETNLKDKNIALFGSYGWGDGEWMREWEERVKNAGGKMVSQNGLIINDFPDDEGLQKCKELGALL